MPTPINISPAPVIEAICEIRFRASTTNSIKIFGQMYAVLSSEMPETEQLPVMQLPPEMIEQQPDLEYSVHFRLKNDNYVVGIGNNILSISRICIKNQYESWKEYKSVVDRVNKVFIDTFGSIIESVEKVSVRYVNFFDVKITEALKINIDFVNSDIKNSENISLSYSKLIDNDMKLGVLVGSKAKVKLPDLIKEGLILTLECSTAKTDSVQEIPGIYDKLHSEVESHFFKALEDDYLKNLNPKYE